MINTKLFISVKRSNCTTDTQIKNPLFFFFHFGLYKDRNKHWCCSSKTVTEDIVQSNVVVTAQSGDSVTLTCDSTSFSYSSAVWFRHVAGQKTQFILATYQHSTDYAFYNGFNDTQRFTLQRKHNMFNLRISGTSTSDSGFYYCAFYGNKLDFHFGATSYLIITGNYESCYQFFHLLLLKLLTSVDSETCAGEHSVYWFRHGSGESLPGLIYTHGNRRDECEKSPEAGSPTHSCVYSLPKRNLSRSDAGIYYCAVVTCEDILFGNGTQLDIEGKSKLNVSHSKSFILNVTAQITVIFCSLLIYLVLSILLLILVWLSVARNVVICVLLMFTFFYKVYPALE
uniref:Ig-like domain-containing protein n=1 Tax=Scleropages formosus TaxID=113540 RepID=A0A8C9R0Q6_SCLFO